MHERFVAVLEAAFASGLERRASASVEVASTSRGSAVRACDQARRYASVSVPVGGTSSLAFV